MPFNKLSIQRICPVDTKHCAENTEGRSYKTSWKKAKVRRQPNESMKLRRDILLTKTQASNKMSRWLKLNNNLLNNVHKIEKKTQSEIETILLSRERISQIKSYLEPTNLSNDVPKSVEFVSTSSSAYNKSESIAFKNDSYTENCVTLNKPKLSITDIEDMIDSMIDPDDFLKSECNIQNKKTENNSQVINDKSTVHCVPIGKLSDAEFDSFMKEICVYETLTDKPKSSTRQHNSLFTFRESNEIHNNTQVNIKRNVNKWHQNTCISAEYKANNLFSINNETTNTLKSSGNENINCYIDYNNSNLFSDTSEKRNKLSNGQDENSHDGLFTNVCTANQYANFNNNAIHETETLQHSSQPIIGINYNSSYLFSDDSDKYKIIMNSSKEVNDICTNNIFQIHSRTLNPIDIKENNSSLFHADGISKRTYGNKTVFHLEAKQSNKTEMNLSLPKFENFTQNVRSNNHKSLHTEDTFIKCNLPSEKHFYGNRHTDYSQISAGSAELFSTPVSDKSTDFLKLNSVKLPTSDPSIKTITDKFKIDMDFSFDHKMKCNKNSQESCSSLVESPCISKRKLPTIYCSKDFVDSRIMEYNNITEKASQNSKSSSSTDYFLEKSNHKYLRDPKKAINTMNTDVYKNHSQSLASTDYYLDGHVCEAINNTDMDRTISTVLTEIHNNHNVESILTKDYFLNKYDRMNVDLLENRDTSDLETCENKENAYDTILECLTTPSYKFSENIVDLLEAFTNSNMFIMKVNYDIDKSICVENISDYINSQTSDTKIIQIVGSNEIPDIQTNNSKKRLHTKIDDMLNDTDLVHPNCNIVKFKDNNELIITKIKNIFRSLSTAIAKGENISLSYPRFRNWKDFDYVNDKLILRKSNLLSFSRYNDRRSVVRFKIMIYLLRKIYNMLMVKIYVNQREIYYQIIKYVHNSRQVFSAIECIGAMLEQAPFDLRILSTSRGLAFGNLKITMTEGDIIQYNRNGGTLIPNCVKNIQKIEAKAYFILVVEKDAVFQKLCQEDVCKKIGRPFILITGKGYPDISTRLFLKILWKLLSIPIFILTDCDPFGIEIMLCYKFGSLNIHLHEELGLPKAKWLGVHPSELNLLNIEYKKMTENDIKKAKSIANRCYMQAFPKLHKELDILIKLRRKAEIEGLIKSNNFLSIFYLPNKLFTKNFI